MKKRFFALFLSLFAITSPAWSAINATAVWEVRTGGATTNGAGFDSAIASAGTDYTLQTAAQLSLTDMACTTGGVTVTSATGGFTSAMIGNALHINSGTHFTAGYYFVKTRTDTNTITVDRDPTDGTNATAGSGKIGGAHSDPGLLTASIVGGNTMYLLNGTYSITSASTNVAGGCISLPAGTTANPTMVIGYSASRAPGNTGTKPLIQASGIATFVLVTVPASGNCHIDNLSIDGASLTSSRGVIASASATVSRLYRCKIANCTNSAINGGSSTVLVLCEITGCATQIACLSVSGYGTVVHDNTITGWQMGTNGAAVIGCVCSNNTGASSDGFQFNATATTVTNCTSYGNGRDGFRVVAAAAHFTLVNCIAENNAGWGFNASAATGNAFTFQCGGYNNTSGLINTTNILAAQSIGTITATGEIFTTPASNDFSLNNSSIGGAMFRAGGIPGSSTALALPGLSTNAYLDGGAVQSQANNSQRVARVSRRGW